MQEHCHAWVDPRPRHSSRVLPGRIFAGDLRFQPNVSAGSQPIEYNIDGTLEITLSAEDGGCPR